MYRANGSQKKREKQEEPPIGDRFLWHSKISGCTITALVGFFTMPGVLSERARVRISMRYMYRGCRAVHEIEEQLKTKPSGQSSDQCMRISKRGRRIKIYADRKRVGVLGDRKEEEEEEESVQRKRDGEERRAEVGQQLRGVDFMALFLRRHARR